MDCNRCLELIDDMLDRSEDGGASAEYAEFNNHIAGCAECRQSFEFALSVQNAARGLVEPPEALLADVMFRAGRAQSSGRRFVFGRFTALAAAAAVMVMVAYFGGLWRPGGGTGGAPEMAPPAISGAGVYNENAIYPAGGYDDGGNTYDSLAPLRDEPDAARPAAPPPAGGGMSGGGSESAAGGGSASAEVSQDAGADTSSYTMIRPVAEIDLSGMTLAWEMEISDFDGGRDAVLSLYTEAYYDGEHGFVFDDGQDWALILESGEGFYELFPRRYVQLGAVSCVVYRVQGDAGFGPPHVLVTVSGTAGYQIYDCEYDNHGAFRVSQVFDPGAINYLGRSYLP
ncbi:MAG: hypothetical protein FWH06_06610 [Oscillospiraceae bacterium]|nr:hypothetical protein [Oscillospiraceae bacterium]